MTTEPRTAPQYALLDCRSDPTGQIVATGDFDTIRAAADRRNRETGCKRGYDVPGIGFVWDFMTTSILSDEDCRQDLVAVQRRKLAAMRERDQQEIALRSKQPLRPLQGTTNDVDGLALFDAVRSPAML